MRAGNLDRRIIIHSQVTTRNERGEDIAALDEGVEVWAEQRPISGNERFVAQQFVAEITTLFTIRYRTGITPLNIIAYEGRYYDVLAVLEIGRREGLAINARARAE